MTPPCPDHRPRRTVSLAAVVAAVVLVQALVIGSFVTLVFDAPF